MNWSYLWRQYLQSDLFAACGEHEPPHICVVEECPTDAVEFTTQATFY